MFKSIQFTNFRVLKDATLNLGPMTLLVGANGSGKSTVVEALRYLKKGLPPYAEVVSAGAEPESAEVVFQWGGDHEGVETRLEWRSDAATGISHQADGAPIDKKHPFEKVASQLVEAVHVYSFNPGLIARANAIAPNLQFEERGANLSQVLDQLRDVHPEKFEALNTELEHWLPEFSRILFETTSDGKRTIALQTREGSHRIKAPNLSNGTLVSLATLTLAYLPEPPRFICFEEPERGMHPRLLRHVKDALYRLSHPGEAGESRAPVQVLATTHSPYLLDQFSERIADVVVVNKTGLWSTFDRLADMPHVDEILADSQLGEVWYSGALGGIPAAR